jgi:hypothetical protein
MSAEWARILEAKMQVLEAKLDVLIARTKPRQKREAPAALKTWSDFVKSVRQNMIDNGWRHPVTGREALYRDATKVAAEKKRAPEREEEAPVTEPLAEPLAEPLEMVEPLAKPLEMVEPLAEPLAKPPAQKLFRREHFSYAQKAKYHPKV